MFPLLPYTRSAARAPLLALACLLTTIALVVICIHPVRAASAINPAGVTAPDPSDLIWASITLSTTVTPAGGGVIVDPSGNISVTFPRNAVTESLHVALSISPTATAPVDVFVRTLGSFTLTATNLAGEAQTITRAPWTLQFTYTDCANTGPCLLREVDEASLRCRRLDPMQDKWLPVDSSVNVFTNRVHCNSLHFGQFALVADPLYTSGETSGTVLYLPVLMR